VERPAGGQGRHAADHRDADPHGRRARRRQLLTGGQIITVYYAPFFFLGNGFLLGVPFAVFIAASGLGPRCTCSSRARRSASSSSRSASTPRRRVSAGVHERLITVCVYVFCAFAAGVAGLVISSNVKSADGNNAGVLMELDAILAVTLGGTALTGGRFSLAGSVLGALIIQTLTSTIYSIGVPPEVNMVVKAASSSSSCCCSRRVPRRGRAASSSDPRPEPRRDRGRRAAARPAASTRASCRCWHGRRVRAHRGLRLGGVPRLLLGAGVLNLLIDNAFLCIVGVGMTFVILSGGIDLSVGALIALTTMVSAALVEHAHWSAWQTIPLVLTMGAPFGALMGWLIQRFRLQPFIVTLAGMFLARGLCYLISIDSISITDATYTAISQERIPLGADASITSAR
jgi:ribose/xylose/arabinose/galactoside ABC-type transport system permease subunit